MRTRHLALMLLVVTIWGTNFLFAQVALRSVPPLTLTALRFILASLPAIFFIRRPAIPVATLLLYGLANFALQFGLVFSGMKAGVPAGLASLVLQVQVFFTMGLSMWAFGERPLAWRWVGAVVAFAGIGIVGLHARGDVNPVGVGFLLLGALAWSVGNLTVKRAGDVNALALVIWGSAVSAVPLVGLSLLVEGPAAWQGLARAPSLALVGSVAYIVYISTLVGYSLWAKLLRTYSPSVVVPFTLLVPIVALLGSVVVLGEGLPPWKLGAAALVLAGVALNVLGGRVAAWLRPVAVVAPVVDR